MSEITRVFQVTVRDSGSVYADVEDFKLDLMGMVGEYGLPADIVDVVDNTSGAGRKVLSTGSPALEPSEFHDVAGANIP